MRNVALLGTRLVLGSYLAVHGAQKLFGTFGGSGLDKAGAGFDRIGLRPGRTMAITAGVSELGGGVLTAAGIADPAGPLAIMGAMSVAATTHRAKGPLNARGGCCSTMAGPVVLVALRAAQDRWSMFLVPRGAMPNRSSHTCQNSETSRSSWPRDAGRSPWT